MKKIIVLALLIASCSPEHWINRNKELVCSYCVKDIQEVIKIDSVIEIDTVQVIDQDSVMIYLKCDSLDNVYIEKYKYFQGKYIKSNLRLEGNLLTLNSYIDSLYYYKKQLQIEKQIKKIQIIKPDIDKFKIWLLPVNLVLIIIGLLVLKKVLAK